MTDGDDTYPVEPVPEMVREVLDKKVDMVVGDRLSSTYFTENKRPFTILAILLLEVLLICFLKVILRIL